MEENKLGKFTIQYLNSNEYHTIKREIWGQDCYYFETKKDNPYIIDIGSHIGISILYFKHIYPNSKILGFEPNPNTFKILEDNVYINNLKEVSLINKAIWKEKGTKKLYIDNSNYNWESNSSFLEHSWSGKENTKPILVKTTTLDDYLTNTYVDCLKIDTEGSELSILKSIRKYIYNINNIFIEYHPTKGNKIKDITDVLGKNFSITYYNEGKEIKKPSDKDLITIKAALTIQR